MTATFEVRPAPAPQSAIEPPTVGSMALTTIEIDSAIRDELAEIAEVDFKGASIAETVRQLVIAHQFVMINARYDELRADPVEWASYQAELRLTDQAAGDGLEDASEEYPEYNQ
jgi:hypothetical protein